MFHFPCVSRGWGHLVMHGLVSIIIKVFSARGSLQPAASHVLQALHVCVPNSCTCGCTHTHAQMRTHTDTYRHTCKHRDTPTHVFFFLLFLVSVCPQPKHLGVFIPLSFCSFYSMATHVQSKAKPLSQPNPCLCPTPAVQTLSHHLPRYPQGPLVSHDTSSQTYRATEPPDNSYGAAQTEGNVAMSHKITRASAWKCSNPIYRGLPGQCTFTS